MHAHMHTPKYEAFKYTVVYLFRPKHINELFLDILKMKVHSFSYAPNFIYFQIKAVITSLKTVCHIHDHVH